MQSKPTYFINSNYLKSNKWVLNNILTFYCGQAGINHTEIESMNISVIHYSLKGDKKKYKVREMM